VAFCQKKPLKKNAHGKHTCHRKHWKGTNLYAYMLHDFQLFEAVLKPSGKYVECLAFDDFDSVVFWMSSPFLRIPGDMKVCVSHAQPAQRLPLLQSLVPKASEGLKMWCGLIPDFI